MRITVKEQSSSTLYNLKNNILEFTRPVEVSSSPIVINLIIDSIDFAELPEGQGLVGDFIEISQPIKLRDLNVSADASDFGTKVGDLPDAVSLDIELNVTSADVKAVQAVIVPEYEIDPQRITIGELPEFLNGENIVLDVYNPLIMMKIDNDAPVTALLNADIVPEFSNSQSGTPVHIGSDNMSSDDALVVKEGHTDVYISRRGYDIPSGQLPAGWNTPLNLVVDDLGEIIKTIPDELSLKDIRIDIPHKGNSETGYYPEDYNELVFPGNNRPIKYDFLCDYDVSAPLAFGEELNIEYSTDIKDWNDTFNPDAEKDFTLDIQEAIINMTFINAIPLTMNVTAAPIDINGNEMNNNEISVEMDGTVKGGNLEDESLTPLVITIKATPDALKRFDGLRIKIVATSPDPDFHGVTLNEKQGLKLDKITAKIKGGITMDLSGSEE